MVIYRTKRIIIVSIVALVAVTVVCGLFSVSCLNRSNLSPDNLNVKLEHLVSEQVGEGKSVGNCVLAVTKGDGSYS